MKGKTAGCFIGRGKEAPQLKEKRHEKGRRKPDFPGNCGENPWFAVPSIESMDRTAVWIGQPRVRSTAASGSGRRHRPPGPQTGSPPRYRRRPARSPRGHGRPERPGNGRIRRGSGGPGDKFLGFRSEYSGKRHCDLLTLQQRESTEENTVPSLFLPDPSASGRETQESKGGRRRKPGRRKEDETAF